MFYLLQEHITWLYDKQDILKPLENLLIAVKQLYHHKYF